jgi:hypothetical protein
VLLNRLYGIAEEKRIHTAKIEAPEGGALPQLWCLSLDVFSMRWIYRLRPAINYDAQRVHSEIS